VLEKPRRYREGGGGVVSGREPAACIHQFQNSGHRCPLHPRRPSPSS